MEFLNINSGDGLYQVVIMVAIVALVEALKQLWLSEILIKIKNNGFRFLFLAVLAFSISLLLTLWFFLPTFNVLVWLRASFFNWLFAYVFYDAFKNILLKSREKK